MSRTHEADHALAPSVERAGPRRFVPPTLMGFVLLLALLFGLSYTIGHSVGPVAPGMRESSTGGGSGGGPQPRDMGGMDMGSGSGG